MRDVSDELHPHIFSMFKFVGHLIEAQGQLTEFIAPLTNIAARERHPLVVMTFGNASTGMHHALDRRYDPAADEDAH